MPNINPDGSFGTGPKAAGRTKVNPFTAQDLAIARQIVDSAHVLTDFYRRCTNCGLDVAALQSQVDGLKEFAEGIIREFGEGTPSHAG